MSEAQYKEMYENAEKKISNLDSYILVLKDKIAILEKKLIFRTNLIYIILLLTNLITNIERFL